MNTLAHFYPCSLLIAPVPEAETIFRCVGFAKLTIYSMAQPLRVTGEMVAAKCTHQNSYKNTENTPGKSNNTCVEITHYLSQKV
jgi:hypothetical protein